MIMARRLSSSQVGIPLLPNGESNSRLNSSVDYCSIMNANAEVNLFFKNPGDTHLYFYRQILRYNLSGRISRQ